MNIQKTDPICGMTVNPQQALSTEREGETHWFCSDECREQFLAAHAVTQPAGPCAIVIFGASGDLTKRKLLPALCNLLANGTLTENFAVIGVGRKEWSDEDFRQQMGRAIPEFATQKVDPALWKLMEERMSYCTGGYDDPATYQKLAAMLAGAETAHHTGDPKILADYPAADLSVERIGDLLPYDLAQFLKPEVRK